MPRRILVTGAAGFVGGHLLPILEAAFPEAVIAKSGFDLRDRGAMKQEIRADPPDACVHLGAISAIPAAQNEPDAAWQINLHGTISLARTLLTEAPHCTMLFSSTADAYGSSFKAGLPVTEATALAPANTYGATKAAADLALGAMVSEGLRVIRIRPFNHTGPGQSAVFVVAAFARQVALIAAGRQAPVMKVGALDPLRDFLDVRDVCAAYALCLERADDLPPGVILNIASGIPRRIGSILEDLQAIAGISATVETDQARLRPSDMPTASGDSSAARSLLGWVPKIKWEQTLSDILNDWRMRIAAEPS